MLSRYRYRLEREVSLVGTGRVLFVMLNPSTATDTEDDPTIRKCTGFARSLLNAQSFEVGNLYAWRATDPRDLARAARRFEDVIGPENDRTLCSMVVRASLVVFAWGALSNLGAFGKAAETRARDVDRILRAAGARPACLGRAANGQPRHPLMLPYATKLEPWEPPT